jgi:hypothetical protein
MLPLMRWRYAMADGNSLLGIRFSFLDYIALALILPAGEEILRRPREGWPIYVPGFILGLLALAFRDRSPQLTALLLAWFRAPKRLAVALRENAELERQIEDQKQSAASVPPSKLTIQSATYGALLPGAKQCDVTNCLRQMISGDSLVLQIQNANFSVGGLNYVPKDPLEGEKKWLKIEYSFDGGDVVSISRREDYRLALPEDTFVKEAFDKCREDARYNKSSYESDSRRAAEAIYKCEKEKSELTQALSDLRHRR